jgi:hypothetical protein
MNEFDLVFCFIIFKPMSISNVGSIFFCSGSKMNSYFCIMGLLLWCLTPLSTIFLWQSVLLVEETGVLRENHRPAAISGNKENERLHTVSPIRF